MERRTLWTSALVYGERKERVVSSANTGDTLSTKTTYTVSLLRKLVTGNEKKDKKHNQHRAKRDLRQRKTNPTA